MTKKKFTIVFVKQIVKLIMLHDYSPASVYFEQFYDPTTGVTFREFDL